MKININPQTIIEAQTKRLGEQLTEIAIRDAAIEQLQEENAHLRVQVEQLTRNGEPEEAESKPTIGEQLPV